MESKPRQVPHRILDDIAAAKKFEIEIETRESPREFDARLKRELVEAWVRRVKELILYAAAIAGAGFIAVACFKIASNPNSTPDDKKWSTAILASIVAAVVGYLVRGQGAR